MTTVRGSELGLALQAIPCGKFVLTCAHDNKRSGVLVTSVQVCGLEPPLICVSCRKGHAINPIIRDSRRFAVCQVSGTDKLILRKFAFGAQDANPFDSIDIERMTTGAPVFKCSALAIDCEAFRHFDLEADHELYIGLVVAARVCRGEA